MDRSLLVALLGVLVGVPGAVPGTKEIMALEYEPTGKRLTRIFRESSSISEGWVALNWPGNILSFLPTCFIVSRITESAGEPHSPEIYTYIAL